jgi:uncharacterized protein YndB with AHSA1/START domain
MVEKASEPKRETSIQLNGDREIVIERNFRAPARIVFEAYTKPEFVRRWWAPKSMGAGMADVQADVRAGGKWRYVTRAGGADCAFSGEYKEVSPYTRLVYTAFFEPMMDAGATICTVTFEERGETTRLVSHELYPSADARQAAVASGMENGIHATMDQLAELAVSLFTGAAA